MARPRSTAFTVSGTSYSDEFDYFQGQLTLNGLAKPIPAGTTSLTLSPGAGNDLVSTDTPHSKSGMALFYDGGKGIDTIDFTESAVGVAVNLYQGGRGPAADQRVYTGFTLEPVYPTAPEYYDPDDPQKILTLWASSVETHNLRNFESVIGSRNDDYLSLGSIAGATADGGDGNDYILGWSGPDRLIGGADNDFLFGKGGNDIMEGGAGADQFQVLTLNGDDIILDFKPTEGDWLYIAWQQTTDTIPDADDWQSTSYVDADGNIHSAIRADFTGGSVTLVDLTLADVPAVMSHMTDYHWVG